MRHFYGSRFLLITALPIFGGCASTQAPLADFQPVPAVAPAEALSQAPDDQLFSTETPARVAQADYQVEPNNDQLIVQVDATSAEDQQGDELSDIAIPRPQPDGLTVDEVERLAMANNPAIRQASAAATQASGIQCQVGLAPNPSVGYFAEEVGNDGSGGLHGVFYSQTIVRGDKLNWNREVISHDVNAMNWRVETQKRRIRTDVRLAFYRALTAQSQLALVREFEDVAKEGISLSEERLQAAFGTRPDVLQSQIQLNEVELLRRRAELEFEAAMGELSALTGVNVSVSQTLIGKLPIDADERVFENEFERIASSSPQLADALAQVDRARANLQRQKVQAIPNVNTQVGLGGDDGTGNAFANLQIGVFLPINNQNEGNIQAAYAGFCAATQNVERLRQEIKRDLNLALRDYNVARATVQQYESMILPKATESLELIQEAYTVGEIDFLRVLTVRRTFFDTNLAFVQAQGELAQAIAKIDGLLLLNGLSNSVNYQTGDDLRSQALNGQ